MAATALPCMRAYARGVQWRTVCVGDLVLMHNQEAFPADVLLLASSHPEGRYVCCACVAVCARARVCVCV